MKVLVFDIFGDYGHFRKFYTTTSPLTFSFPPPPTVAGILGAIYGTNKDKNEYLTKFSIRSCKIAIRILNSIKKIRMGINLLETKGKNLKWPMSDKNLAPRTQIRTEFLKDPCFRIYINHIDEDVFNKLAEYIQNHKTVYTISLGLSELLADFKFVGIYDAKHIKTSEIIESFSILRVDLLVDGMPIMEMDKKYYKEKIPILMNSDRVVEQYENVIYEPDGKTIKAKIREYWVLENGECIVFF